MEPTKTCFKCGKEQPLTEFYPHPRMADGHLNKCKTCTKVDVRGWHKSKSGKRYEKAREKRPERKAAKLAYQRKRRAANPARTKAHAAVERAVRNGTLIRKPCELCGNPKSEGHHADYSKPLEVSWLCFRCHRQFGHKQNPTPKPDTTLPLPFIP